MLNELLERHRTKEFSFLNEIKCAKGHQLHKVCIGSSCKSPSIHCSHQGCPHFEQHLYCPKFQVSGLSRLIQEAVDNNKQFIVDLQKIERQLMQKIIEQSWVSLVNQISFNNSEDRVSLERLFGPQSVSGSEAKDIFQRILAQKEERKRLAPSYLQQFRYELERQFKAICEIRINFYKRFLSLDERVLLDSSTILDSSCFQQDVQETKLEIDSLILTQKDEQFLKKMSFLSFSLGDPHRFELIYRASAFDYSAAAFHRLCDGVPNTLVLIKTSFDKTIGGFTPVPWRSAKGEFSSDESRRSCLLQLDNCQLLRLTDPNKAIYCNRTSGPLFGQGHDLAIYDQCNLNTYSYTNFPRSYTLEEGRGQSLSCQMFSGAKKASNFLVKQYEVFRLIYDD